MQLWQKTDCCYQQSVAGLFPEDFFEAVLQRTVKHTVCWVVFVFAAAAVAEGGHKRTVRQIIKVVNQA